METLLLNQDYTGKVHPQKNEQGNYPKDASGQIIYPYLPSDELIEMVNLAIALERPLLLQGEPGCGKTQLAQAVASELGLELFIWNIKSISRAQDGLYTYDNLARLRDAQLLSIGRITDPEELARVNNPKTYLQWGELGKAFISKSRAVLLIDEIDKADIDFPNDLLLELDKKRFTVPEITQDDDEIENGEVVAKEPPIIFITTNQERDLPDAFLRRCLFHYIKFPQPDDLIKILLARFFRVPKDDFDLPDPKDYDLISEVVKRFVELRKTLEQERRQAGKKVSTSELIDWFSVLRQHPQDQVLKKLEGKLPYLGVLLKNWEDYSQYVKRFEAKGKS